MHFEHISTYDFIMIAGQVCWDMFLVVIAAIIFATVCSIFCAALDRYVA